MRAAGLGVRCHATVRVVLGERPAPIPALRQGLDDPLVLEVAAAEQRVIITRNNRDFAPLAREWAEASRHHADLILIWTLDHSQFAAIATGVECYLDRRPEQAQWRHVVVAT